MSHAEQRACPVCSTLFTWNSSRPTHRFCNPKCKAIWAREIKKARKNGLTPPTPGATCLRPGRANPLPEDLPREDLPREETLRGKFSAAQPAQSSRELRCPLCQEPIAVVSMLLPPAAAYVDTPSQSVTNIN
ncbi:hypothetical protein [Nonomuraea sp. NPDC049480]|uniref:hypothetical protein n=1 Tax=Nonomuraea sp. NPDC049480 TaxID=3364353 RepID=UPI0037AB30CA